VQVYLGPFSEAEDRQDLDPPVVVTVSAPSNRRQTSLAASVAAPRPSPSACLRTFFSSVRASKQPRDRPEVSPTPIAALGALRGHRGA
jgi:hypothetical protein